MLPALLRRRRRGAAPGERPDALPDARAARPAAWRRWALHPALIGAFPILSLYAHNVYETPAEDLVAPLAITLAGTLAAWLVLWPIARDARRAALATSLLVGLFFANGLLTEGLNGALDDLSRFWIPREHHLHPLIVLAVLAVPVAPLLWAIIRRPGDPGRWTAFLNTFALILVALPLGTVALAKVREPARPVIRDEERAATAAEPGHRPDIYYIILDAYARSDVMEELFGFDNGPFLRRLEAKGFFVARDSTSNYAHTGLSLCSSLNCEYLDRLIDPTARDTKALGDLIGDNFVINSLRPLGYKFVTISTGHDPTEHPEADVYLYPRIPTPGFHRLLMGMTPLRSLLPEAAQTDFYTACRERTLFILDHLHEVAAIEGPKFTFAHIISPHPPFVFGEDGEDTSPHIWGPPSSNTLSYFKFLGTPEGYRAGYRRQAMFLTKKIEQTIDRILAASPEPPIIILQSDHGSGLRHHLNSLAETDLHERMSILNCYYFPGRRYEGLSDDITPVNSFRVVLNTFFGAHLPLLESRNYFSLYTTPLTPIDVTERVRSGVDREREYTVAPEYLNVIHHR